MRDNFTHYIHFDCWIEDSIFNVLYKNGEITIEVAQEVVEARLSICEDKVYPMLSDIRKIRDVDRDARQFLASELGVKNLSACSLVVNTYFQKVISNLFILTYDINVPTKVFTDKDKAVCWLEQFKRFK